MNDNLSPKELALYLAILVAVGAGIAFQIAPTGVISGLGAGLIVAIYYFTRRRPGEPK